MIHVYPNPADSAIATIDTNVDTLITDVAAIKADTDAYLDASVSTRASQTSVDTIDTNVDTLVTNVAAIKADTDAYLDVAVSSVKFPPQGDMVRDTSVSTQTLAAFANELEGYGAIYTAGALTANVYGTALLDITAGGFLWLVVTYRESSFTSAALATRITIDGNAWSVVTDSASTTALAGHVAHGVRSTGYDVVVPVMIRFNTSLKVEVMSTSDQTTSKVSSRILYSVDA